MRNLLKTVTRGGGTGAAYGVSGFETFAKTGTTSDDKDRWFVAGTPYYVAAVWYGYDQPKRIWNVSGNPAGRIFKEIMDDVHEDLDDLEFPTASGVVARSYCTISGDIANSGCPKATGYYKSSNVPNRCKSCSIINGIGQGIPSVIPNTKATTKPTTDNNNDKTTASSGGNNKTTRPSTTNAKPLPTQAPTQAPTVIVTEPVTQAPPEPTQAPETQAPTPPEPQEPVTNSGAEGIAEQAERMIRGNR